MEMKYRGAIKGGKLKVYQMDILNQDCKCLNDMEVEIIIKKASRGVSKKQTSYFYGVVLPLVHKGMVDSGYRWTLSQAEEFVQKEFLTVDVVNESEDGISFKTYSLNEDMPSNVFTKAVDELKQFCSENLNVYIPDPSER